MKYVPALSAMIVLSLSACDTMTQPITSGDFDPLRPPGGNVSPNLVADSSFKAGQFVRTSMNNTAFFKTRPKGDADADKLLQLGASMKVISTSDSYVKVELDSGEIGFVPAVMLEDPNAVMSAPSVNPNEFQVYPPIGGYSEPLPPVLPSEQPPEGAIPTVIDPEAPAAEAPPSSPVPLPPNGEEENETPAPQPEAE